MIHCLPDSDAADSCSSGYFGEEDVRLRSNLYKDSLHSKTVIKHMLRKTMVNRVMDRSFLLSAPKAQGCSSLLERTQEDGESSTSSKNSASQTPSPLSPTPHPHDSGHLFSKHLKAKKARVENIIRGMSLSPSNMGLELDLGDDGEQLVGKEKGNWLESKKKRKLTKPTNQYTLDKLETAWGTSDEEECQQLKEQLQALQRQLSQLHQRFVHVHEFGHSDRSQEKAEWTKLQHTKANNYAHWDRSRLSEHYQDLALCTEIEREVLGGESRLIDHCTRLSQMLKKELSSVVTQTVDSVLQQFSSPLGQKDPNSNASHAPIPTQSMTDSQHPREVLPGGSLNRKSLPENHHQNSISSSTESQSEAMSLVMNKSPSSPSHTRSTRAVRRPYQFPQVALSYPLAMAPPVKENLILSHLLGYSQTEEHKSPQRVLSSSPDRSSLESVELPREAVSMRSGISSYHMNRQPFDLPFKSTPMESFCLPQVKMECIDLHTLMDGIPYTSIHLQEGLNPSHLKKAKLMFFFTRYPSSNILKTYFPDVKFNRCITSQLIKWFSNFREFYYIQMEKFARQAVMEGTTNVKDIMVGRTSELYRTLNMHYNKANDFQVPDQFLEIATVTLREFFCAIMSGKDSDPSWKKSIYKTIAKLDSDIPDTFQSPGFLEESLQS